MESPFIREYCLLLEVCFRICKTAEFKMGYFSRKKLLIFIRILGIFIFVVNETVSERKSYQKKLLTAQVLIDII